MKYKSLMAYAKDGDKLKPSARRREDVEQSVRETYPYLYDRYPVKVVQDSTFNSGYGDVETMLGEDAQYGNGYYYENPYSNQNTIVFNNNVKNPNNAAILDYLHVLRKEDPEYQSLLKDLHNAVMQNQDNDIISAARHWREDDEREGRTLLPMNRYIENEEDGWLRNMFHPGTSEEMKEDKYYPDKKKLLEWNPSLQQATSQIYNYLHPIEIPTVVVTNKK